MTAVHSKLCVAMAFALMLIGAGLPNDSLAQLAKQDVYFAKEIWTGKSVITDGMIYVVDGQIKQVGPRDGYDVPATAQRHELGNQVIIPGLVAAQTNLGGSQDENRTLTPQVQAVDGFDFFADQSKLLKAGITSAQVSPGNARLMPGTGAVVQLAGDVTDRIVSEQENLRIILTAASRQPPRIYEPPVGPVAEDRPLNVTRPQVGSLPASLAVLRQIFKQAKAGESEDEIVTAVAASLKRKTPIRISASTTSEIRGAIDLATEFEFQIILDHCRGLEAFENSFDKWSDRVVGVVLTAPSPGKITNPSAESLKRAKPPWQFARALMDAKIPVAIRPASDTDLVQTRFVAGQFMQGGLTAEEVMTAITATPAELSGVPNQVGLLEPGRRADFVTLNDSPFCLHAQVTETFVSGDSVYRIKATPETMVVKASQVYVGDGKFIDGNVVVKGKTVRGVGAHVSAPVGATVRDFGDAVIVPGFVDMGAGLGFGGAVSGTVSLSTKLGPQLDPEDPAIKFAREQGITTAFLKAGNGSASPVLAFKLGNDTRVIGEPVAIRFKFSSDTAAGLAANEKLLKAGKAYDDQWKKYAKDLASYEVKKAEADKKAAADKAAAAKKAATKTTTANSATKKPAEKKEDKDKKTPVKKPTPKEDDKDEKKEKPLPDPITGTWEGSIDLERIPERMRGIKMELALQNKDVSGSLVFFGRTVELNSGSFDRDSRELKLEVVQGEREIPIQGKLDAGGDFKGSISLGRFGEAPVVASRTVDKSKKVEKEKPEEKDKPEKEKPEKEKPEKDKPEKDKPADQDQKKDKPEDKKDGTDQKNETDAKDDKKPQAKTEKPKEPELKAPKKPRTNAALEPYRQLFEGKLPAIVEATNLYSIKAAAELFSKKYKLRTIIVGADDLARQPDLLKDFDVSLITGPGLTVTIDKNPATNMPQLFAIEQFKFGFQSNGTTGSGQLPGAVQFAIGNGLSSIDALNALTQNPPAMISEKMNFGRIARGKDADLVVLSGAPFEFSTKVLAVMIDGQWVYEREEQK